MAKRTKRVRERTPEEWLEEINLGLEYRKTFGLEEAWTDIEAKFYSVAKSCDVGPNIIASKGDSIISALSVPEVVVMVDPRVQEAVSAAPVVESFDNALLSDLEAAEVMESALTFSYLFGVGFIKVGYDSEFGYDERFELSKIGGTMTQFADDGRMIESGRARNGMPWMAAVLPHNVVVPWGTRSLREAPQVFHKVIRRVEDVKADPKYSNTSELEGTVSMKEVVLGMSYVKDSVTEKSFTEGGEGKAEFIELWEIMDRTTRKVIVIAIGESPVEIRNDVNLLQIDNELPWIDVCLTTRTRSLWVTPPAYYVAPHQNELDDIHAQAKKQRRASIMKLLARKSALDVESKNKLLNSEPGMLVEIDDAAFNGTLDDVVKYIGGNPSINVLLHQEEDVLHQNAREALGVSRNFSGEFSDFSRTTAVEVQAVQQGGEIRLGRKQKSLRRSYHEVVLCLNRIVATFWRVPQAVKVLGESGATEWKTISAEMLRSGKYAFKVSFSTEHYSTPFTRLRDSLQIYRTLMSDPRVDQESLLRDVISSAGKPTVKRAKSQAASGEGVSSQNALPLSVSQLPTRG